MATGTTTTLIDDLDGGTADQTVRFGWGRVGHEIDLSDRHATDLRTVFEPYLVAARRTGGRRRTGVDRRTETRATSAAGAASGNPRGTAATQSRSTTSSGTVAGEASAVRAWTARHGIELSGRGRIPGRIPGRILEAYRAEDPAAARPSGLLPTRPPGPSRMPSARRHHRLGGPGRPATPDR